MLAGLLLLQIAEGETPNRLFAAGKTGAIYMEPADLAAKPFVTDLAWTADGGTLIVKRLVPPPGTPPLAIALARQSERGAGFAALHARTQIVTWSAKTHLSKTVIDLDPDRAQLLAMEPMSASDRLLVTMIESPLLPNGQPGPKRTTYSILAPAAATLNRVYVEPADATERGRVFLSPKRALGAVVTGDRKTRQFVAFFGPDGKLAAPLALPPRSGFSFSVDGLPSVTTYGRNEKGKATYRNQYLDPRTGALGADVPEERSIDRDEDAEAPVAVDRVKSKDGASWVVLHLAGGKPEEIGLVTSDGTSPLLSPKNDAVAYVTSQGAYVRALTKVDRKAYDDAMAEASKQAAMSKAKQLGLAMQMYALDADDAFPPDGDIKDIVGPYVRNNELFGGFTYTFGGGTTSSPETTQLGFVTGAGGQAVIYADGHVVWVPNGA